MKEIFTLGGVPEIQQRAIRNLRDGEETDIWTNPQKTVVTLAFPIDKRAEGQIIIQEIVTGYMENRQLQQRPPFSSLAPQPV